MVVWEFLTVLVSTVKGQEIAARNSYLLQRLVSLRRYNQRVFQGKLPADMEVTWSAHLKTTAGVTKFKMVRAAGAGAGAEKYSAKIELSTKVLDSYHKMASTLCHEMVRTRHAA